MLWNSSIRECFNFCCYDIIVSCDFQERLLDIENWHFLSFSRWLVFEWELHLPAGDTILLIGIFWLSGVFWCAWGQKVVWGIHFTAQGQSFTLKTFTRTTLTCVLNIVSTIFCPLIWQNIYISGKEFQIQQGCNP